ncbi:outer membrane biogenesis protein BamB [Symmachiella dynata]|uniref:PQQ-binding-like beta-propeller repeat protein n=1 Tax=Symmachiella dynata TaxID=2527995 RepID=UPI0011897843|nr:PQQ-binding-like beta-propeller repeat protein [Symmachiella dynata]QDT49455.1 outer membrane biogenesis protein BamB [Symmachiella dynata]
MRQTKLLAFIVVLSLSRFGYADDWPQWLGPERDSVWRETGIIDKFPADGPPVKWRMPVDLGYSGPAVADGRVFVTDYVKESGDIVNSPGGRNKLKGKERVLCFSAETGEELWKYEYDRTYNLSYAAGPRCTPTVAGGKVYTLGAEGDLVCLTADKGELVWRKDLTKEYNTTAPIWGFSGHPLVDGDLLYCLVGGKGSVAVAFNKDTGKEVWRALTAEPQGYCPPTMIEAAGIKQLLIWDPYKLNSLDPKTGDVLWSVPLQPAYEMSIIAPRQSGDLLFASGIGRVGVMLKLDNDKPGVSELWRGKAKKAVYSAEATPILEDGMIYGVDCHDGALVGARIEDGERLWQTRVPTSGGKRRADHGTAFLVKQEDRYFLFSETGDLIIAKFSPEGYDEISRFHAIEPTNEAFGRPVVWSHPAFAEKSAFIRNDKEIIRVDLAE